ncbi:gag-protease polyprotein [Trifolium repens]|nr:gag-protease polyprotein [Trifolium repens]
MDRNEGSINRPPVLDGSNYDYWKARMIAFIKSMDQKAWKAIVTGWNHPIVTAEDGSSILKGERDWTPEEEAESNNNSKALNAIFNGVDENIFKLINTCTEAKQAWEILQTAHEGTSKVRMSKLQLLTSKFENLRMEDDETISEFNTRVRDIANSCFALGEKIPEEKLARKILRSLPKRFSMKVTAIEESQDLSTMKVDELIVSLQTFEMTFEDRLEKKMKNLAFKSKESQSEDCLSEAIALLTKKFNNSVNRVRATWRTNIPDKMSYNKTQGTSKEETNSEEETEKRCYECEGFGHIRIQCPNFLRKQKKGMAAILSDSEDESEEEDTNNAFSGICETSCSNCFKSFTDTEGSDTNEEPLHPSRNTAEILEQDELMERLIREHQERVALKKIRDSLQTKLKRMTEYLSCLECDSDSEDELPESEKIAEDMIGLGFDHLFREAESAPEKVTPPLQKPKDQMSSQKSQHPVQHTDRIIDHTSQHYDHTKKEMTSQMSQHPVQLIDRIIDHTSQHYDHTKKEMSSQMSQHSVKHNERSIDYRSQKSVQTKGKMSSHMSQHPAQHKRNENIGQLHKQQKKHTPRPHLKKLYSQNRRAFNRCDHCGRSGHVMKECFKIHGYPQRPRSPRKNEKKILVQQEKYQETQVQKVWRPKEDSKLKAHTCIRLSSYEDWYFDSGCSKHMTGDKKYLKKLRPCSKGSVTFGDGAKGRIKGIGKLRDLSLPYLDKVLLVEGLTTNLISISQLCEQGLDVYFSNSGCIIVDDQKVVMKGVKTTNKCYKWTPPNISPKIACLTVKEENDQMCYQMSQHLYTRQEVESLQPERGKGALEFHTSKSM